MSHKSKLIKEFVEDFTNKLEFAYTLFQERSKKRIKIKKCYSQAGINDSDNSKNDNNNKFNFKKINLKKIIPSISSTPIWKPVCSPPTYFEKLKRLKSQHELNTWERERLLLCKRTYEKESELPQKKNFVCRKMYGDDLNIYPNTKKSLKESIGGLGKIGKNFIIKNIKNNLKMERMLKKKEELFNELYHSKKPVEYNPWKYSNHIINEFSTCPVDKIHTYAFRAKKISRYKIVPFKRTKIYGDYFDKNIYS